MTLVIKLPCSSSQTRRTYYLPEKENKDKKGERQVASCLCLLESWNNADINVSAF
jgi:hypothetical protein